MASVRLRSLALVALQGSTGVSTFLLWSAVSHTTIPSIAGIAVRAYAYGMVGFLPLTLGLPYLLPNFYRSGVDVGRTDLGMRSLAITIVVGIGLLCCVTGLIFVLLAPDGGTGRAALAVSFAGALCTGATLQQLARIHLRVGLMLLGTLSTLALPLSYLAAGTAQLTASEAVQCAGGVLLGLAVLQARLCLADRPGAAQTWTQTRQSLTVLMRLSLPLVPHLVAMAVLLQGVRLSGVLGGSVQILNATHYVMLFLGIAFGALQGIHGLLTVSVQSSPAAVFDLRLSGYALSYGLLGLVTATAATSLYLLGAATLFPDSQALTMPAAVAMASVPAGACAYYFLSALSLRAGRTTQLAGATVTAAIGLGVGTVLLPSTTLESLLLLYAVVFSSAPAILSVRLLLRPPAMGRRTLLKALTCTWTGYGALLLVLGLHWGLD